ncbi:transporter substrate-binding domain-containing protein [Iocasia frigidifontis]|uniref:Transporter substrate-binding domain-containing protein n=1 Tax=Iocasia fonsfrigidae TaxID=2682810 RepID=A0A8A7K5P8_9FIRM|nr:basic amino acid ABC transporter substrate-binding protein [Iocasia fonsfrigidae]QTL96490.1 transporter substrate-binding domain-containing protein [Iocasia fonsfrigidae]
MNSKKIFSLILITVLVCAFSGLAFAKTYVVGTSAGFPPFEYVDENGDVVGFDVDLVKAIGELKGFDVEVKDISFDSLPAALKTGNIDMIAAGMTITTEREKVLDFSQPYWTANQSIIVTEDAQEGLTLLFGDHDIGVQTGTTGDIWVTDNIKEKGILTGKVAHYDTFVLVVSDLINGNLDGVVLDTPVAESYAAQKPVKVVAEIVTGEEYGIAVDEGNTELLDLINEGIDELKANGKMDELITKYFK